MVAYDLRISSRAKADLRAIKKYLKENASDFTAEKVANQDGFFIKIKRS